MVPDTDIKTCKILSKMLHRWLLLTFMWSCTTNFIHFVDGETLALQEDTESNTGPDFIPFPFVNYFDIANPTENDNFHKMSAISTLEYYDNSYLNDNSSPLDLRRKRSIEEIPKGDDGEVRSKRWIADVEDAKLMDRQPYSLNLLEYPERNKEKRSFSPWGGKRTPYYGTGHGWTSRESSMPKRVRFSPWGGKRSQGFKPETTYYSQIGQNKKKHDIKVIRASSTGLDPLRQYNDFYLKKDGKRKVKFSSWGGKRSSTIERPEPGRVKQFMDSIVLITDGSRYKPNSRDEAQAN